MGLVVVVDQHTKRPVHVGEGTHLGLKVTPQWLERKIRENPATFRFLNTDHYTGKDEGALALFWIVEDLFEEIRVLRSQVMDLQTGRVNDRDVYGTVPRETMGGGA